MTRPIKTKSIKVNKLGDRKLQIRPTLEYTGDKSALPPSQGPGNPSKDYEVDVFVDGSRLVSDWSVQFDKEHQEYGFFETFDLGPRFGDEANIKILGKEVSQRLGSEKTKPDPDPKEEYPNFEGPLPGPDAPTGEGKPGPDPDPKPEKKPTQEPQSGGMERQSMAIFGVAAVVGYLLLS